MPANRCSGIIFPCFASLAAGLLLGSAGLEIASSRPPSAAKPPDRFSTPARLGATLYMQTAGRVLRVLPANLQ